MINYQSLQKAYAPQFTPVESGTPYDIGGAHNDVYRMLAERNAAQIGMNRNQMTTDFENEKLQARQNQAMAGLQNLMQARKNQADLANQQRSMRLGTVNSLLSGLFR